MDGWLRCEGCGGRYAPLPDGYPFASCWRYHPRGTAMLRRLRPELEDNRPSLDLGDS